MATQQSPKLLDGGSNPSASASRLVNVGKLDE